MEGTKRPVPHHRHLTARSALRRAPALQSERLAGAMVYYDAQVDDARHTLTVARTAAAHGAIVATRTSVTSLLRSADGIRVTGARVRDEETGQEFDVAATRVLVCAGVWTDLVHSLGGIKAGYQVRMSKGVHLVLPRSAIDAETGMIVRTEKSVLFFIPWGERWIVGTTDTDWSGDRAEPLATGEDVDYILAAANRVLAAPLTRADVIGVYAGLRPLVAAAADTPTTKLSREHVVDVPVPGLASIAGGKFTTYRLMARDVVDAAVADFPRPVPASVTDQLPLLGSDGLPAVRAAAQRLAEDRGLTVTVVEHLLSRFGSAVGEVLDLVRADRSLGRPLLDGYPYLRAEVAYAVTHEGALHIEDVLARRIRLLIESPDAGMAAAAEVGAIMGGLLGWGRRRRALEVRQYLDFAATNTEALRSPAALAESAAPVPVPA
jgi:glycerol-3-phosphate dehydrogenase